MNHFVSVDPDKREYRRLHLRLPTEYFIDGSLPPRIGYTVNICEGGLLIHIPEKLKPGQHLSVKFYYYSDSDLNSVQALAEVVRTDSLKNPEEEYACALKFMDLSAEELETLRKFLKHLY